MLDAADRVELRPGPVGVVVDRADRSGVVEERVGISDLGREPELVADVRATIAAVGDVDLVEDVVTELVEVGAAVGFLQRNEIGEDSYGVTPVRAAEGVHVGVVSYRVLRDLGRLAM